MELCLSTTVFGKEDKSGIKLENALKMIKAAGWDYIEISRKHLEVKDLVRKVQESELKVWSVHGGLHGDAVSSNESARKQAVKSELLNMEKTAHFAPCPYVVHYLYRFDDPCRCEAYRRSITELLDRAEDLGFILAVETAPHKPEKYPRYPNSAEIANFVRSFSSKHIALCIDINHSNLNESLSDVIENCSGLISNIHISDNNGKEEEHLPPGQGKIEISRCLRKIRLTGYQGPCNVEVHLEPHFSLETLREINLATQRIVEQSYL